MTKKDKVRLWLTELAEAAKRFTSLEHCTVGKKEFQTCSTLQEGVPGKTYVHLYDCVEDVADIMGFELAKKEHDENTLDVSFMFDGVRFMGLVAKDKKEEE